MIARHAIVMAFLTMIPLICTAQTSSGRDYAGVLIGGGISSATYTTGWFYREFDPNTYRATYHYPWHVHKRIQIVGFFERRALLHLGSLSLDGRGEVQFGFIGGTKEDWLPLGETISSGGATGGISGLCRITYPMTMKGLSMPLAPFAGIGLHYSYVNANGEGVGGEYADRGDYHYDNGWSEHVYGLTLNFGVGMDFGRKVVSLEYRLPLIAGAATDWAPKGDAVQSEGAYIGALVIGIGLKRQ